MSRYRGRTRTNYFQVKNEDAFLDWADEQELKTSVNTKGAFAIFSDSDLDFEKELQSHLADGEIAVIYHVGYEAFDYFAGRAYAMDNTGKSVSINLYDVYAKIQEEWGKDKDVTSCSY